MEQAEIDALRAQPVAAFDHLIDGKHVPASDGARMDVISPIDGTVLTTTAAGTTADLEAAIASARAAFRARALEAGISAGYECPHLRDHPVCSPVDQFSQFVLRLQWR